MVTLSRPSLDDNTLYKLIADLPERCIALMEDIDVAFRHDLSQRVSSSSVPAGSGEISPTSTSPTVASASTASVGGVSLSGLLNALDGIAAQEGRILFATTNDYGALDPALCRPGRMDVHIEFHHADKSQAEELFRSFYSPSTRSSSKDDENTSRLDDNGEKPLLDETDPLLCGPESSPGTSSAPPTGTILPRELACELAKQFSAAIPNRELSVAALQGYLMIYKTRPLDAVRNAPGWVSNSLCERGIKEARGVPSVVDPSGHE